MKYTLYALLIAVSMFLGMVLLLEVGRRIGARRLAKDPEGARVGLGALEAGVFGLLGLLIAFTFSGAASRFDARRQMVIQETNTVSSTMNNLVRRFIGTGSRHRPWAAGVFSVGVDLGLREDAQGEQDGSKTERGMHGLTLVRS